MSTTQTAAAAAYAAYIQNCREYCSSRIDSGFNADSRQANALRVETLRDRSPRCGMKPPAHWAEGAKAQGWGLWVMSGGSPSVFGHCDQECPMREFWARTAPTKRLRIEGARR